MIFKLLFSFVFIGEHPETVVIGSSNLRQLIPVEDGKSYELDASWIINNGLVDKKELYQTTSLQNYFSSSPQTWDSISDSSYYMIDTPSYGVPTNEYPGCVIPNFILNVRNFIS